MPDTAQYRADRANKECKATMYHMGVLAYTTEGYENLVNLSTLTHRNHHYKPLVDYQMLAQLAEDGRTEGLAVTTGCYFGYLAQSCSARVSSRRAVPAHPRGVVPRTRVYVEVQNHHITHDEGSNDEELADGWSALADTAGLPVVITQDAHYLEPEDRADHEGLKRLVAFGPDPDDAVFPGDGFHVADAGWIRDHHGEHRLARGMEGLADLLGRHTLTIPVLDSYSYSVPEVVADPLRRDGAPGDGSAGGALRTQDCPQRYGVAAGRRDRGDRGLRDGRLPDAGRPGDRLAAEKDIVFQTRGSAAGSLVCWLLGISNVDPIKWDLCFERFLSKDRTKPPDVDLDVAHDRRDELLEMLNTPIHCSSDRFVGHLLAERHRGRVR